MTAKRRIVLLGGGFSWAPGSPLDAYVLRTAGRRRPKVCFVPTASGDAQSYVEDFHAAFAARDCEPAHLPLFRRDHRDLRSFVLSQDVVHVGGGNTAALFTDGELTEVVAERPGPTLHRLEPGSGGAVRETGLPARLLT